MKTIHERFESVKAIAADQKVKSAVYRKSSFCFEVFFEDVLLLYNTFTGELLRLNRNEAENWASFESGFNYQPSQDYDGKNVELINRLIKGRYLVPEAFDEMVFCDQVKNVATLTQHISSAVNRYVVFTTTDCNARCFYCFEKGQRRIKMDEHTAETLAEWMIEHAENEPISIRWFGGEPLYNSRVIDIISERLRKAGCDYTSTIVTNAYLFNNELIKKASGLWRIKNAIITLDGTEEIYNKTKAYICNSGSAYKRVLENIENLALSGIFVTVNLNMDAGNAEDLKKLAHELGERFKNNNNIRARCELLKEYNSTIHKFSSAKEAVDKRRKVNEILASYGLKNKKYLQNSLKLNSCMADNPKSVTVLPDGRIGRCEHFGDSEEVGSIFSAIIDNEKIKQWKERREPVDECKTCPHYPYCFRLKKCNEYTTNCNELNRLIFSEDLKDKIINSYLKSESLSDAGCE